MIAQNIQLKAEQASSLALTSLSPDEADCRATGAVRDAALKHDLVLQALVRARLDLHRAELREKKAGLEVAYAFIEVAIAKLFCGWT